jgi:hypothetical protein
MDEIEDPVFTGVQSRGYACPGYFALRRVGHLKSSVAIPIDETGQVGQEPLFGEMFEKIWIEGVKTQQQCPHCERSVRLRKNLNRRDNRVFIWREKNKSIPESAAKRIASTWKSIPPVLGSI